MVAFTFFAQVLLPIVTTATPQIAFPINSQVPPLAQVAQPFSFQYSQDTCTSSTGAPLTYALQGAPTWLALDSTSRTLSGTPTRADVGDTTFELVASDDSGSLGMPVTLVVSGSPPAQLTANITDVLSKAGPLCDIQSLSLRPRATFSISFPQDTFVGSSNLTYAATSEDRSPLPSWIRFDPTTLALTGTTPPPVPNPQTVPIRLIASDINGFASQSAVFSLIISDHTFVFSSVFEEISATPGMSISISTELLLDGDTAAREVIASIKVLNSNWLILDAATLTWSGAVPSNFQSHDAQIVASDIYGNNAYTNLRLTAGASGAASTSTVPRSISTVPQTGIPSSTNAPLSQVGPAEHHQAGVVVAVVIPVVASLAFIIFCAFCVRRRRRRLPRDYVDHFARGTAGERSSSIFGCRFGGKREKSEPAGKSTPVQSRGKGGRLSMAIATTSPMGSPDERLWNSQERIMSGLGVFVPEAGTDYTIPDMHPLRSNAVPPPPKRSSKRLSRLTPRPSRPDVGQMAPGSERDRSSWSPTIYGAKFSRARNIPKCENCESANLRCLNCGSRQIKPALEQARPKRVAQADGNYRTSIRRVVEGSFGNGEPLRETRNERERREAEEYVSQPLSEKFQEFQKQRRGASGTHERFSNCGSGSSTQSIRRWRSERRRACTSESVARCFSESSMPIPEESPRAEGWHVPGQSYDSENSWETDRHTHSSAQELAVEGCNADERGRPNQDDQRDVVDGIQMVHRYEDSVGEPKTAAGAVEGDLSSDARAFM